MIWWNLILFAVAFIATALLAPKPQFEDARPESLDPNNFPLASEADPVPWILGKVRAKGPNVIWYGGFRTEAITKRVKTGFFSSKNVIMGYKYYLSLNLAVALGPNVRLCTIIIDDEPVSDGTVFYGEGINTYFIDPTINLSTTSLNYEEKDALAITGLTGAELDAGAALGELQFELDVFFEAVFQGGPSSGAYVAKVWFHTISGDRIGSSVGSIDHLLQGGTIYMELKLRGAIPVGTRYISYAAQLSPFLVLFTDFDIQRTEVNIYGPGADIGSISSDIYEPELYGGNLSGGGHIGNYSFYPGNYDQIVDPDMELLVGVDEVPAYRGTAHIVMPDQYIGEQPSLHKMEFEIARYTEDVDGVYHGRIAEDHPDINIAEAIYQIITHPWNALGLDVTTVNVQTFIDAAETLRNELNGCSVIISTPQQAKTVVQELLRQCDGVLTQDADGSISLKLIRYDYTPSALPLFDETDILEVTSFSKSTWADVRSQVKVTYASRLKDSKVTAIAQNMATINMLGGKIKTAEISFPFCYDGDLANQLAARELSQLSIPLFSMSCVMNRNAYQLRAGDPIKVSWPEYGLTEVIMRVQKIDLGELLNNKIVVELLQDTFAVSDVLMATPETSGWIDDKPIPSAIVNYHVAEMPYFYTQRIENIAVDGYGLVIPFPVEPNTNSTGFDFISGITTAELDFSDPENIEYPISGLMTAEYLDTAGFLTGVDSTGFTIDGLSGAVVPPSSDQISIRSGEGGLLYIGNEWMAYEGVTDNMDGTFTLDTIHRGLFGSRPETHADDARIHFLTIEVLGEGEISSTLLEDATVYFKFIDRIGAAKKDATAELEYNFALQNEANRPLRPRNFQVDGDRILAKTVAYDNSILTWSPSDREAVQVTYETDAAETPDQTETYDLDVWLDGIQSSFMSEQGISSPHTVDFTGVSVLNAEFRLYSRRTVGDLRSSLHYASFPVTIGSQEIFETQLYVVEGWTVPSVREHQIYIIEGWIIASTREHTVYVITMPTIDLEAASFSLITPDLSISNVQLETATFSLTGNDVTITL